MEDLDPKVLQEIIESGRKAVLLAVRNEVHGLDERYRAIVAHHIFQTARNDVEFIVGLPNNLRRIDEAAGLRGQAAMLSEAVGRGW
jgi:hypothetical protein